MIDENKKILQIHIPKTAGQSLSKLLFPEKDFLNINKGDLSGATRTNDVGVWNHLTYDEILKFSDLTHEKLKECTKVTCARNPWDKLISSWKYFGASSIPFNEFVDMVADKDHPKRHSLYKHYERERTIEQVFRPQVDFIMHEGVSVVDHLLHMETFDEDCKKLLTALGRDSSEVPKINTSKHKHYSEYYDKSTKEKVAEMYKEDISFFEYAFEG